MKSKYLLWLCILILFSAWAPNSKDRYDPAAEEEAIRAVLDAQQVAWNNGDLVAFMEGYWKSDSLQFMSSRGINHGWQETLEGYRKRYPDRAAMGTLGFEILQVTPLCEMHFVVTGRYHLVRSVGNLDGVFTLIFRKINGKWVAIYDHTA